MCCMEFHINEHWNIFEYVILSSVSMNMGTYLNVLYGILSQ